MKRQKRDAASRAFKKGYFAGVSGRPKEACPTMIPMVRQEWVNGWREGREANWSGMIGVSGIHKLPDIAV